MNEALLPHDLPVAYDSLYNAQLPMEQNAVAALSSTEALQVPNAANTTGFDNLIVTDVDQYFANFASDFSTAVTSFESGNVTPTTALNLLGDDIQLANATNYVNLLDEIFPYLGIESSSAAGAADAAAASTALASANPDDPAVFYYSADPTNVFSPVYTISPTGAEDVVSTDASGDVVGTQEFTVSYFGIPLDTFNGGVEYSPVSSPLDPFGSPYVEDVSMLGVPGTLLPENTGFLVEQFGGGYGYLTDLAINSTGTSDMVGDFILTPFGPDNITDLVNEFLNFAGSATDATSAVDPSSFIDLLSSIGL